jgi:WD40 repeat protein
VTETTPRGTAAGALVRDSPYQGLSPFQETDAAFFRGRERERERIIANLVASHLTLLYGPSGVGKTSLLRAGVARRLQIQAHERLEQTGSPGYVVVVIDKWRPDARAAFSTVLSDTFAPLLRGRGAPPSSTRFPIDEALQVWADALDADLLVILDQFEEYFLYHPSDDVDEPFAAELIAAVNRPDLAANFLISLREDAVAKIDRFKGAIPALWQNYLRVDHLDRKAARAAILEPIAEFNRLMGRNVDVEEVLVDAVLDQVRAGRVVVGELGRGKVNGAVKVERVETPYLQLVLARLWEEDGANDQLRLATLERLGGADQIVRAHLAEAMSALPISDQVVAAEVFRYLVTPGGSKIAHNIPDLEVYTGVPQDELRRVLARLSEGSLRVLRPTAVVPDQEEPSYEIYHDVLSAAVLDWRARFLGEREVAEVQLLEEGRGRVLAARQVAEAQQIEQERAAAERRRLLGRLYWVGAIILAAAVIAFAALAYVAYRESKIARAHELAARALLALPTDPDEALRLAVASLDKKQTLEGATALRAAVANHLVELRSSSSDGHKALVAVAFSSDGRSFLTVDDSHHVFVSTLDGRAPSIQLTDEHEVLAAAFTSHDRRVATATADGTVRLWNLRARHPLAETRISKRPLVSAAFSEDASRLVAADRNGRVVFVSGVGSSTPPAIHALARPESQHVALSADGKFAAADGDGFVRIWEVPSRHLLKRIELPTRAQRVALSAAAQLVAVVFAHSKTASVWTVATGNPVGKLTQTDTVFDVGFSPDGTLAATASQDGTICILSVGTEQLCHAFHADPAGARALAFSPAGNLLVTGGRSGGVRLWSYFEETSAIVDRHRFATLQATFSPAGDRLVTVGTDGFARLFDVRTRRQTDELSSKSDPLLTAAFTPDGRHVVVVGFSSLLRFGASPPVVRLKLTASGGASAAFSPDATRVVMADGQSAVLRDATTGTRLAELQADNFVTSVGFSQDGTKVVVADTNGTVAVWPAYRASEPLARLPTRSTAPVTQASFGDNDRLVLTADADGVVREWDWRARAIRHTLRGSPSRVLVAAFSPDLKTIITGDDRGITRLWDARSGKSLAVLAGHTGSVVSAAFSPDGQLVLTASADGTARLWGTADGRILLVLRSSRVPLTGAWFDPNQASVLVASRDGVARLYPCRACEPLRALRLRAARAVERARAGR